MIDRFVTYLLIAGCLIFGALVLLELRPAAPDTATPNEVSRHPDTPSAAHRESSTRLDELLAVALARPLFSNTRRPPQATATDNTNSDLADMRLTGIVTEPDHHLAIFAVNGAKPLRVTEGEAVSGWRIESITPREVSLSGPGGTKTLEPKLDPNLVQQAPPAPPANPAARQPAQPQPQPPQLINVPQRPGIPPRLPVRPPPRPQLRPPPGRVQQ
jgi:general secretion pathway protein N